MSRQPNGMLSPSILLTKRVGGHHKHVRINYNSYRALRKDLKDQLKESVDNSASVSRSKRGQWGEWFETWVLSNGKPEITREGWQ